MERDRMLAIEERRHLGDREIGAQVVRPFRQGIAAERIRKHRIALGWCDVDVRTPAVILPPSEGCNGRRVKREDSVAPPLWILEDRATLAVQKSELAEDPHRWRTCDQIDIFPAQARELTESASSCDPEH